jgi:hypothetical protein
MEGATSMNDYFKEAAFWLRKASRLISDKMDDDQSIEATLQFAIGVELIVKGILWDVNPLFVYENPECDTIAGHLYSDKMTPGAQAKFRNTPKEVSKKDKNNSTKKPSDYVNPGVISAARAQMFSKTAEEHCASIQQLFQYRGAIAHRPRTDFPIPDLKRFTQMYFMQLVGSFVAELKVDITDFIAVERLEELQSLSNDLVRKRDLPKRMEEKRKEHQAIWEQRKDDKQFRYATAQEAWSQTSRQVMRPHTLRRVIRQCPVCGNEAVFETEGKMTAQGWKAERVIYVDCGFCDFNASDPAEIDYFRIMELANP